MTVSKTWPGGSSNLTPTVYSIPEAGELNWASLTDFLSALADGSQTTTFQKFATREAVTSPVSISTNDCIVSTNLTVAGAVAVTLPAGDAKQIFYIVDGAGDAVTNNITITPDGVETIAGQATLVLNTNGQSVLLAFDSSNNNWIVVYNAIPNPTGGNIGGFTGDRAIISTAGGNLTTSATTAAEIAFVNGVTSAIQTQLDNKQDLNDNLSAISILNVNGIYVRTSATTATTRDIVAASARITVANGDGVSGDPAVDVDQAQLDLSSIGGQLELTSQVSGELPIASGGTGQTGQTAAFDALAPTTTKGDLIVNNGTDNIRLVVGSDGEVLTADSGEVSGLTFTAPLTNPMDSAGDLIVGGASGAATKLDSGTQNYLLQANGAAAPSWVTAITLTGDVTIDTDVFKVDTTNNRVGIGTATPTTELQVEGRAFFTAAGTAPASGSGVFVNLASATNGRVQAYNFTGTSALVLELNPVGGGVVINGTTANGELSVNDLVGTGNPSITFDDLGTERWRLRNRSSDDQFQILDEENNNGVTLDQDSGTWGSVSDRRLKKEIVDLDYGLDTLLQLKPRKFKFKKSKRNKTTVGFVAQEVRAVISEAVSGAPDSRKNADSSNFLSIMETKLIPVIIAGIKEFKSDYDTNIQSLNDVLTNVSERLTTLEGN